MDKQLLKDILDKHEKWLNNEENGERANLCGENLCGENLYRANLRKAVLFGADMRGANLFGADLRGADLRGANMMGANLNRADLSRADLGGANLSMSNLNVIDLFGANLSGADLGESNLSGADLGCAYLIGANMRGANLNRADLSRAIMNEAIKSIISPISCPESGSFIGWKKAGKYIIKLLITEDAKRSNAFSRKCRCSKATCLSIENIDGTKADINFVQSQYDSKFVYAVGKTIEVSDFDEDRYKECAPGIHFFITRQEAVDY